MTANVAYRAGSPAAIGISTTAVIRAVVDSGPIESCLDEPSTAYTASGPMVAQSPTTGGRPATSAYAMTCGTR